MNEKFNNAEFVHFYTDALMFELIMWFKHRCSGDKEGWQGFGALRLSGPSTL